MRFEWSATLASLCLGLILSACGTDRDKREPPQVSEKSSTQSSSVLGSETVQGLHALRDSVLARATRSDTVGLLRLQVDDSVYRAVIYPLSSVYDSTRDEVFQFVIGMHKANSNKGLRRFLHDAASTPRALTAVYDSLQVAGGFLYRNPTFVTETPGLRVFGSALCFSGKCQVLSYAKSGLLSAEADSGDE